MDISDFQKKREPRLDDLMEVYLKDKDFELMEKLLKQVEQTYDRFEYYMERLEHEKNNTIPFNVGALW